MQARAIATLALTDVIGQKRQLSGALPTYLEQLPERRDQAFAQELCYGVLRWYHRLNFIMQNLLEKEIRDKDTDIKIVILLGLYQLEFLRTPPHAAVSATVDVCNVLNKAWAKNLVNAILRRYLRERKQLQKDLKNDLIANWAHPKWLIEQLQLDYPEEWQTIVETNNTYPPMCLRINVKQISRKDYLEELKLKNILAENSTACETGIQLKKAIDVSELPLFDDGYVSVQDMAGQFAAPLLDIRSGQRVLDACAAPGGKLAHILELLPDHCETIAVEYDENRFKRLQNTLARIRQTATLIRADTRLTDDWWDGTPFDRILLDVPCSATGVIRRHPDIKILRCPRDIADITKLQLELMCLLWPLLSRGGKLLYVTCSILKVENDIQIGTFLENHTDARSLVIDSEWGNPTEYGRQILPGENDMDGFYYACLEKE